MYLLDKKIYLKHLRNKKILSAPNRRVPNPGFWQNKDRFNRQPIRHTTQELQDTFWEDHHFTMQIQPHNVRSSRGQSLFVQITVCLNSHFSSVLTGSRRNQNPRFWTLRIFSFFRFFKYIFLSSRYIDSDHFCDNLCYRPKVGNTPILLDVARSREVSM